MTQSEHPVPDQVLTPLALAEISWRKVPSDPRLVGASGHTAYLIGYEAGFAAALAGVPKEAGEAVCECGEPEDAICPLDSIVLARVHLYAGSYTRPGARCAHSHQFKPSVVAAPVEDADAGLR